MAAIIFNATIHACNINFMNKNGAQELLPATPSLACHPSKQIQRTLHQGSLAGALPCLPVKECFLQVHNYCWKEKLRPLQVFHFAWLKNPGNCFFVALLRQDMQARKFGGNQKNNCLFLKTVTPCKATTITPRKMNMFCIFWNCQCFVTMVVLVLCCAIQRYIVKKLFLNCLRDLTTIWIQRRLRSAFVPCQRRFADRMTNCLAAQAQP